MSVRPSPLKSPTTIRGTRAVVHPAPTWTWAPGKSWLSPMTPLEAQQRSSPVLITRQASLRLSPFKSPTTIRGTLVVVQPLPTVLWPPGKAAIAPDVSPVPCQPRRVPSVRLPIRSATQSPVKSGKGPPTPGASTQPPSALHIGLVVAAIHPARSSTRVSTVSAVPPSNW